MENKIIKLRFREENREIFEAIRTGRKTVETRAATERYQNIQPGDTLILVCGKDQCTKQVLAVKIFKSITALLQQYQVQQIHPKLKTEEELKELYYSFPGYQAKIAQYGLVAMELG